MRALTPTEARAIRPDSISDIRSSSPWSSSISGGGGQTVSVEAAEPVIPPPSQWIVVKGMKVPTIKDSGTVSSFSISSLSSAPPPTPSDRSFNSNNHIKFAISDPKHNEAAQKAADVLQKQVTSLENKLASDPEAAFLMPNGQVSTAGHMLDILQNTNFTISDQPSSQWRAGANVEASNPRSDGNNDVTFDLDSLMQYENTNAYPDNQALNEIILHEVSHDTNAGISETSSQFAAYVARTGDTSGANYDGSPEFQANEQFTNALASDIASSVGIPVNSNPTYGFGNFSHS